MQALIHRLVAAVATSRETPPAGTQAYWWYVLA
jgi:hypothetical protein